MLEPSEGSVTHWISDLKGGDHRAADHLWRRYFHRLVALARARLGQAPRQAADADEEDAALSAFYSLCDGAARGCFLQLGDRDDLWQLLAVITARKAADQGKRQRRLKRGGGRNRVESAGVGDGEGRGHDALDQIAGDDPGPELAAMLAEEYQRRLDALGDDTLRRVAVLRLEGHTCDEIAGQLGCARRTVARKLDVIRDAWTGAGVGTGPAHD